MINYTKPYVTLYYNGKQYGQTQVIYKTLSPIWNKRFTIKIGTDDAIHALQGHADFASLSLRIFDEDMISHDFMGESIVPLHLETKLAEPQTSWFPVGTGTGTGKLRCEDATGEIQVKLSVSVKKIVNMVRGNTYPLPCRCIRVSLQWLIEAGQKTDLDTSCVAIDKYGNILMDETIYFGNLLNSNESIHHSGDAREGGIGEFIDCNLGSVPISVRALYFIVTVATPDRTLKDVKTASVSVMDTSSNASLCHFTPGLGEAHTAMFLMRVTREHQNWTMSIIEDTNHTARDVGTLIPEIKGYSRDLCPSIDINPTERIAVMRKGASIRVKDYANGAPMDQSLVFGLSWDIVTNGRNIDLDASVICLNASLDLVDTVSFKQLCSRDNSIQHGGDERKGNKQGDDEEIFINLHEVQSDVIYVGFVITSYSGQELDDVSKAKCHLFNASTKIDLAQFQMSNNRLLDKHTGLLMACLYRDSDDWNLQVIGNAVHGKRAADLVGDLQHFLRHTPAPQVTYVPEPDIIVNIMPEFIPMNEEEVIVNPVDLTGNIPAVHMNEEEVVVSPFALTCNVPAVPVP